MCSWPGRSGGCPNGLAGVASRGRDLKGLGRPLGVPGARLTPWSVDQRGVANVNETAPIADQVAGAVLATIGAGPALPEPHADP